MKIVFVTNNKNKLIEIKNLLSHYIEILSLKDIGFFDDIEETATSLLGNAVLKANFITDKFGCNCFADDTGLEVDFLNGKPGVYSARYAGVENDSHKNMDKLLTALKNTDNRKAQFKTVIALNINGEKKYFIGVCKGEILKERIGDDGFGYDPIFKPDGFEKSFAQMSIEEKGKISHRGKAVSKLIAFLNDYTK